MKPLRKIPDKVWKLFKNSKRWTQGYYARRDNGLPVFQYDPLAVCYCISGAVKLIYPLYNVRNVIYIKIIGELKISIVEWNDDPKITAKDVYNLCKKLDI